MLQIDCLLTFGIGASLATAAGDGLKASQYPTQNSYFVFTILHFSLVVAPLNMYMLWEHTGFETMFYYDASMHGIWPALNIAASTLSAIAGFMASRELVRRNKELTAYTLWTGTYSVMLAIVSAHYDRFLYPGGIREFYEGKSYTIPEFLQSQLCKTLAVSLVLMAGPVFYAQLFWPRIEGYMTKNRKATIKWHCAKVYIKQGILIMSVFAVLKLVRLTPSGWDWDRLLSVAIGHGLGLILLLPVFFMSTRYVVTKRIDIRRSKTNAANSATRRRIPNRVPSQTDVSAGGLDEVDRQDIDEELDHIQTNGHAPVLADLAEKQE